MSAESVTLRGQAAAERIMVDVCTITVPDPDGEPVWDDEAGEWGDPTPLTVYTGKCRVRQPAAGDYAEAGGAMFNVSDRIVSIPVSATGVLVGATVTIDTVSAVGDPELPGQVFKYLSPASQQTFPTARRLLCRGTD